MQRHYPLNPATGLEDAALLPWANGNPSLGTEGSYPPFGLFTEPQEEMLSAIAGSGLSLDASLTQLLQAISRGLFLGTFAGTGNALTATVPGSLAIPALAAGLRVNGIVSATNTTGVTLNLSGFTSGSGVKSIVRNDGSALQAGDLVTGERVTLAYDGTSWRLTNLARSSVLALITANTRVKLSSATTFYIDSVNGNDGNSGLSSGSAFRTMITAVARILTTYDSVGYGVTFQLAPGTYEPVYLDGVPGLALTINGGASPTLAGAGSYIIDNTNQNGLPCVTARAGSRITINGVKLQGPQGGIFCVDGGSKVTFSNVIFSTTGTHITASYGGVILPLTAYQINTGAPEHFLVNTKGIISGSGLTISTPSGVAYSNAFANVVGGELDLITGISFTGSGAGTGSTGKRFILDAQGIINVAGAGTSFFPGTIAGTGAGTNGAIYI